MRKNSFENVYGFLMRQLAKSILTEFKKKTNSDYLAIGVLLYKAFNDSFHYAPTLKNSLESPEEIFSSPFPTSQANLWNSDLTIALGKFLSSTSNMERVNDVLDQNIEMSDHEASSYATLYEDYPEYRRQWYEWFNNNIAFFSDPGSIKKESLNAKRLINQLFYFGNFLLTILRKPAFKIRSSEFSRSNGQNIYLCVCNAPLMKDSKKFNYRTGVLQEGMRIPWNPEPDSQERKAILIFALEIYYRWPFDVKDKIRVLSSLSGKENRISDSYFIDATGTPLLYNGEFLGIGYISRPHDYRKEMDIPPKKKKEEELVHFQNELFQRKIKESSLPKFLYNGRFETARKALQKIDSARYDKKTAERIFELSHVYSSAPLVAFIDDSGELYCNVAQNTESSKIMTRVRSNITGKQLIEFLGNYFNTDLIPEIRKEGYKWVDVYDGVINDKDIESEQAAFEEISSFNNSLAELFKDTFKLNPEQFQITSVSLLSFEIEESVYTLFFFNSNYTLLFSTGNVSASVKNSYALSNHSWIRLLIDTEQAHRRIFEQSMSFEDNMRKTFLHYFKGVLRHKVIDHLELPVDQTKVTRILNNCNNVVSNLGKLLKVYSKDFSAEKHSFNDIVDCWNKCLIGYNQTDISLIAMPETEIQAAPILCNMEALELIFTGLVQNAINISKGRGKQGGKLYMRYKIEPGFLIVYVINTGTTMQTKYVEKAGLQAFSGAESSGLGFVIIESFLARMGAIKEGNRHFDITNVQAPKEVEFKFTLKTTEHENYSSY